MTSTYTSHDYEAELQAILALANPEALQVPVQPLQDLSAAGVRAMPGIVVIANTHEGEPNANP